MFIAAHRRLLHAAAEHPDIGQKGTNLKLLSRAPNAKFRHAEVIFQIDVVERVAHTVEIRGNLLDVIAHARAGIQNKDDVNLIAYARADDMVRDVFEGFGKRINAVRCAIAAAALFACTITYGADFRSAGGFQPMKPAAAFTFDALPKTIHACPCCRLKGARHRFREGFSALKPLRICRDFRQNRCCLIYRLRCIV